MGNTEAGIGSRKSKEIHLNKNIAASGGFLDLERLLWVIIKKWPVILIFLLLGVFSSMVFLRYVSPRYSAVTKILIKDTRNSTGMSETAVFGDLGILSPGRNIENEMEILKTSYLMEEVVKRLDLQYTYQSIGAVKSKDLYLKSPIKVLAWDPKVTISNKPIEFIINLNKGGEYSLIFNENEYKGQLGQSLKLPVGILTLGSRKSDNPTDPSDLNEVLLTIKPVALAAAGIAPRLVVNLDTKTRSTVLEIILTDQKVDRALAILNELIEVYNEGEILDKNRIFENTVRFIDDRLTSLAGELNLVEGDVASYKATSGSVDLIGEGTILQNQANVNFSKIAEIEAQLEIVRGIRSQLAQEEKKFEFVPAVDNMTSPSLGNLLNAFNTLLLEREGLYTRFGSKHPEIESVEKQLSNMRISIIESIATAERDLLVRRNSLSSQDRILSKRLASIPENERDLLDIQRQQAIKQQLYLYLLQKREEAALSLSVTVANNRIIESPRLIGLVFPKANQIQFIFIALGLFIPISTILILHALNKSVMVEDHIVDNTSVPIIGTIPYSVSKSKPNIVIGENKRSASAEMFRLIRANLQFVGEGQNNKVIAITSSISGEGKSFITMNLGMTLALAGKRVILIELDLRKPKLANQLGSQKGDKGVTDYLVDKSISMDSIIYKSSYSELLFYIPCGSIPPNPSELILGDRLKYLINSMHEQFDYILIDTPPIGIVSDALLLNKLVDATIYVTRQGVTDQRHLKILEDISLNEKMPRIYIVFNGVKFGAGGYGYGSGYGYGYGQHYGYGNGYYTDEKKSLPLWKRVLGRS